MHSITISGSRYLSLSWSEVEECTSDLAESIKQAYIPESILAVLKGGAVIGALLADRLKISRLYTIGVRSYRHVASKGSIEVYQQPPEESISGRRVLVVDDIVDTGQTLTAIHSILKQYKPSILKTASLLLKEHSGYTPDYYVKTVQGWVFYPWELKEAAEEIQAKTQSPEEARKILATQLGFPGSEVDRALKHTLRRDTI